MTFKDYLLRYYVLANSYRFYGGLVIKDTYSTHVFLDITKVWRIWFIGDAEKMVMVDPIKIFRQNLHFKFAVNYEI